MDERPIKVPDICQKHQWLLVKQANYNEKDPWRALMIATNLVLFQAATCNPETFRKLKDNIHDIASLGCLACYQPDKFGEIVAAIGTSHDLGKIKALGEKWINEGKKEK